MSYLKIAILLIASLAMFSCDQKSTVTNRGGVNGTNFDRKKGCFYEKGMMAGNIVGGTRVKLGDADQKMAVLLMGSIGNSIEFCTANAIGRRVLLTAAHCIDAAAATYAVALYPSITCESGYEAQRNSVSVQAVTRHKGYDEAIEDVSRRTDDIALVFLKEDLPEDYPIFKIANPAEVASSDMYLYGYGRTGEALGGVGTLRRAIVANSNMILREEPKLVELNQQPGIGMCQGDSGGAGFVKIGEEMQILGINSYVQRESGSDLCAGRGFQTMAYAYRDWIEAAIQDNGKIPLESR